MLVHRQDNARGHMAYTQTVDQLVISQTNRTDCDAIAQMGTVNFSAIIGHGGIGQKTREGDGITPAGCWRMAYFLFRADKIKKPFSLLPGFVINRHDSWCDQFPSPHYNQPLAKVLDGTNEALWRSDSLYDIVIVLDHNVFPAISGRGSAIFIHLRERETRFTQGCLAFEKPDITKILKYSKAGTRLLVR